MANILITVLVLIALAAARWLQLYLPSFFEARRFAKLSPLKYRSVPIHKHSTIFWLISPFIDPFINKLPFWLNYWRYHVGRHHLWHDGPEQKGVAIRRELGKVFFTCHPGGLKLHSFDAEVCYQLTHRPREFMKDTENYKLLEVYGENVVTTEGNIWAKHRKITAPPFNERNNALVWTESVKQSRAMLHSFTHDREGVESELVVQDLAKWTMTMALHVIAGAGLNLPMSWPVKSIQDKVTMHEEGQAKTTWPHSVHQMTFQKAIQTTVNHVGIMLTIPRFILRSSPFKFLRDIDIAHQEFARHTREMIARERLTISSISQSDKQGVIQNILFNSANEGTELTEQEMIADLWIIGVAGHETTAAMLHRVFVLLALDQDYQAEICAEIDSVVKDRGDSELIYDDYPKFRYIMAAILEGLRIFPPVIEFLKVPNGFQSFTYNGDSVSVPPETSICVNIVALQRDPDIWGADAQVWNPRRWIKEPGYVPPKDSTNQSKDHANILCPPRGSIMVFSDGARSCLGRKFALVEICAVIATTLRNHKIELEIEKGSNLKDAKKEAWGCLEDSYMVIALKMKKNVKVKFVKR